MTTRETLHRLINELPESAMPAAERALTSVRENPLLAAPEDDEPVTAEDVEAIAEAREAYRRGEYVTNDDLRREIGW